MLRGSRATWMVKLRAADRGAPRQTRQPSKKLLLKAGANPGASGVRPKRSSIPPVQADRPVVPVDSSAGTDVSNARGVESSAPLVPNVAALIIVPVLTASTLS